MALNGGVYRIDPAPQMPVKGIPQSSGDQPPRIARAALFALTVAAWAIASPPQAGAKVVQGTQASVVERVPVAPSQMGVLGAWAQAWPQPVRASIVALLPAVVQQVPANLAPLAQVASWQTGVQPQQQARGIAAVIPADGVTAVPRSAAPLVQLASWDARWALLTPPHGIAALIALPPEPVFVPRAPVQQKFYLRHRR